MAVTKRDVLQALTKAELLTATIRGNMEVPSRVTKDELVDVLVAKRSITSSTLLRGFKRDRLKDLCYIFGMSEHGREKQKLIKRLLGGGNPSTYRKPAHRRPRLSIPGGRRPSKTSLKRAIHGHLVSLGFTKNCNGYFVDGELSKQRIRDLHSKQRRDNLAQHRTFIDAHGSELIKHFASGRQVDPVLIDPELVEVSAGSLESRLFRFACLLWSVPVSQGFGRRLRFLVRDRQNGRLMGLFALGDPVFNLTARDNWVGWTYEERCERLTHVMDAYVLGSLPPYSHLLCGKLVAALMGSSEVKQAYERKYLGLKAVISKRENRARLVLLTTTSALGRSSVYNRLSIPDSLRFIRIGETKGFGHFHFSGDLFELLRSYLETVEHPYASGNRFGMGSNWKIRVVRVALEELGLDANAILKHGIEREVYAVPLARNWKQILLGQHRNVQSCVRPASEITEFCLQRWVVPRAARDKRYKRFARRRILDCLLGDGPGSAW